jgi:serine/threonine protein kinase
MKEDEAQSHIYKLLDSLTYLHSKKIVHRDLKLANILINDVFDIKLADFGLSKNYEESLLQSRTGTPMTMAP